MYSGQGIVLRLGLSAAVGVLAACGGGGGATVVNPGIGTPGGGSPQLAVSDASVNEGNSGTSALTFTVTLTGTAGGTVTVDYATDDIEAVAPGDYAATSGTLSFPAGATTRSITVNVAGDQVVESTETFRVVLTNPLGGAILADDTGIGTITNDDLLPVLAIGDAATAEGDAGSTPLGFTVTLTPASTSTVTVQYGTANGNAIAGSDYTAAGGTLTFAPGETSQPVTVDVLGDTTPEGNESFAVVLGNAVNAALGDGQAAGTITNDDGAAAFGLDARPANAACVAPPRPTGADGVTSTPASAYDFAGLTKMLQAPGDASRWYVLEKGGLVRSFPVANTADITTYLDLSSKVDARGEGGLLGLAFHPDYPATQEAFVSYTAPGSGGSEMVSRISRLRLNGTPTPPEEVILTVNQPEIYHKGGDIAFGPDGYLYIGLGDGATPLDSGGYAQRTSDLLGSMLRIHVAGVAWPSPGYQIPPTNPFAANPKCGPGSNALPCPETFAWGFRNPWRWSIDPDTGRLWLGDVGEKQYEEINLVEKGRNYGWPEREGAHCTPDLYPGGTGCQTAGMTDPVAEYEHGVDGFAVTGGFVYRGTAMPELQGRYLFGDFGSGRIWQLKDNGDGSFAKTVLYQESDGITSFALGHDGEFYIGDYSRGVIRKMIPAAGGTPDTIPDDLVDTGCVNPGDPSQPASGLIPYGVNAPFWSDGVQKKRWLALPDGATIDVNAASGDWTLPAGSVIVKLFRLNGNPIETRLLMRHPDGEWRGYTWEWNGATATRLKNGKVKSIDGQDWVYPSEAQCLRCHTPAGGYSLGPETAQLNGNLLYPATGRTANQLATLDHIGVFSAPLPDPATLPALPDPTDVNQSLQARARSWLHTNCSGCHRPGGPTPSTMDLRYATPLHDLGACNVTPGSGTLGLNDPKLIKPGDAANSVVTARMNRRDNQAMPPLGSTVVDAAAVTLVSDWINSLASCP